MNKLDSIINGWTNLIWQSKEIEKLAMTRAGICSDCKYNELGICIKCSCVLAAKVRSVIERCPINKW